MSDGIIDSSMLLNLSNYQQEMLVGGSDFELSGSNFAHRFAALRGITVSGPKGSYASSAAAKKATATAAQDFLGLAGAIPTNIGSLGPALPLG